MHRRPLIAQLERYRAHWPDEVAIVDRFLRFVETHDDCLLRSCGVGHITASAWILDADRDRALLCHHGKLGRWLQLGGHVDGEVDVERAALREAKEESGLRQLRLVPWAGADLVPLDLDVHPIPARADEPAHEHWDVRFLLRAAPGQQLEISAESNDLRWFRPEEVALVTTEESVLRLQQKARRLRDGGALQNGL
ncbi:MAG: NUDIX hydrolase [Planctomycetes bacterium]|nr:NUDIX hydrolase [Planctomycetota bacterium]